MRYPVARACLQNIAHGLGYGGTAVVGISPTDWALISSPAPWMQSDRIIARRILDAFIGGSMDAMGLPRFMVPAEYTAAVIAMIVNPANYMVCCYWMEGGSTAQVIGSAEATDQDFVTAERLFALVCQFSATGDLNDARAAFEKKTGLAIRYAEGEVQKDEGRDQSQ